jgi:hypothetical protein
LSITKSLGEKIILQEAQITPLPHMNSLVHPPCKINKASVRSKILKSPYEITFFKVIS